METGTQVGYFPPNPVISTVTLEGSGPSDGLSAILYQSYADTQAQPDDITSCEGIVIEGALPPYPDTPAPVSEQPEPSGPTIAQACAPVMPDKPRPLARRMVGASRRRTRSGSR